jgi:DNA-binding transcriptional ArsR family regulator
MNHELPTLFDDPPLELPVLPYSGSSGWSGSDASRERAERADSSGETRRRQAETLQALEAARSTGLTWFELAAILDVHHGAASAALSVLHRDGLICRLDERRERSSVYVAPGYVDGRPTSAHKRNRSNRLLTEILTEIAADLDAGRITAARARLHATLNEMDNG